MEFPERFSDLPEYAFPRLRRLLATASEPTRSVIDMSIGSPRHEMPDFLSQVISEHSARFQGYPPNEGGPEVLASICGWVKRRYGVELTEDRLLLLNGSREGLFNAAMALCPETKDGKQPRALIPNPFYQVYAAAAMAVGAVPHFVNATEASGHLPDYASLPEAVLREAAILYICSPANPQGACASQAYWAQLFELAERYDFRIFADECYADVYTTTQPVGALEVATELGIDPERLVAFHSLSKRSNLAGLRVGFAATGPEAIVKMRQLRSYAGSPIPYPLQRAAAAAWDDEGHVDASRALYAQKFALAAEILGDLPGVTIPEAGFFLWLPVPDGERAVVRLWEEQGLKLLPGSYLARDTETGNPGTPYIRAALVGPLDETTEGLTRLRAGLQSL